MGLIKSRLISVKSDENCTPHGLVGETSLSTTHQGVVGLLVKYGFELFLLLLHVVNQCGSNGDVCLFL